MLRSERRRQIVERIQRGEQVRVAELCEQFGVSEVTIRRDLHDLDREGLLRRVHGGAIVNPGRTYEPPYRLRMTHNVEAKRAIARRAVEMIYDGDTIALDVGTTTLEIALALRGRRNLTVITASLPIANAIAAHMALESEVRLIVTGGIVLPGGLAMTGNLAEEVHSEFHVDKAFIGIGAISLEDGLTEYKVEHALVKRPLIHSARQRIVVADGSKLGRTAFASVGPLAQVDVLITDRTAPEDFVAALRATGMQVVIAD